MYVCNCNAVTDRAIHAAVAAGTTRFEDLQLELGVSCCCGRCEPHAREVLQDALAANPHVHLPQQAPTPKPATDLPAACAHTRLPLPA